MKSTNAMEEIVENKPEDLAERASTDSELLLEVFSGVSSSSSKLRFKSAKILNIISNRDPQKLYPKMHFFIDFLESENSILKWNAIDVIANLAVIDVNKEFEKIFQRFYGLLQEGSLITSAHVVSNSWKIAKAKPDLESRITDELLKVERIKLPTEECRNILSGHAILSFDKYFDKIQKKADVVSFVKRELNSTRNATRAKAEKFLKKHGISRHQETS